MKVKNALDLEFEIDSKGKMILEVCEYMDGTLFSQTEGVSPQQFIDSVIEKYQENVYHAVESAESMKLKHLGIIGYTVFGLAFLDKIYSEKDKALDLMGVLSAHILNENLMSEKEE